MSVSLTKVCHTLLKNEFASMSNQRLAIEVLLAATDTTGNTIACGGSTPSTEVVRTPLSAIMFPVDAEGGAAMGVGYYATISGTTITLNGVGATEQYHVVIVGREK